MVRMTLFVLLLGFFPGPESSAARSATSSYPKILSRENWGAEESLGLVSEEEEPGAQPENGEDAPPVDEGSTETQTPSEREKKCQDALRNYPAEFRMGDIVTHDASGEKYVWPRRYSPDVRLLVLHHTGGDDEKQPEEEAWSGPEQVRAIYRWHTVHNGWGDIGYHYLIDKEGVIYEGRAGGDKVIGAHAYCANTGTVGVALIGNYLEKLPPEAQLRSTRWLLAQLSNRYDLDPKGFTAFHGMNIPVIAMHKDVSNTECPGRVDELIPAIRRLVAARDFTSDMLPKSRAKSSDEAENTLVTQGSTRLKLPRRGAARISLTYKADKRSVKIGEHIATVERSDPRIGLWQSRGENRIRLRNSIVIEKALPKGSSVTLQLMILAPSAEGTYTFEIGSITYTLEVAGRARRER